MPKRVYISGAMTGVSNYREKFDYERTVLQRQDTK